jgi:CAAX protease family protein
MVDVGASVAASPQTLGWLWKGHLFLFDKRIVRPTYTESIGIRLLLLVAALEVVRLATLEIPFLPFWVQSPLCLLAALVSVPAVAGLGLRDVGLRPWSEWNPVEKSYFIQAVIIANVVFPMAVGSGLVRTFTEQPASTVLWLTFIPYLFKGFFQEVLYRGMLQTELVRRWGTLTGITVSNAFYTFGPQHYRYFTTRPSLAVPMFGAIFGIGLLFAVIYHRSRNLWIIGIMHAIGNAYMVTVLGRMQ